MLSRSRCLCHRAVVVTLAILAGHARAAAPLDVEAYVQGVLRAHPGARQASALEAAAVAERQASRRLADPTFTLSWDRASLPESPNVGASETGAAVALTIPWPGTFQANARAGDRAADGLRAEALGARWELQIEARLTFTRLLHARAVLEVARAAEADALELRDLTAKRAELGEAREVDRIKAQVEWLRQERTLRAQVREAEAAEALLRNLAVEPLPQPLQLEGQLPLPAPAVNAVEGHERLRRSNPRLRAARAQAEREAAHLSVARRARVPDLDLTWFRNRDVDKKANGFSLGLRIPLWNANRGEIARATAAAALASAATQRLLLDLNAALERARQELDVASEQARMVEREILPAAAQSLELARFSFREGETSLLELLDAQRTFRATQREAADARLAVALALAEVQRLIGPDFDPGR